MPQPGCSPISPARLPTTIQSRRIRCAHTWLRLAGTTFPFYHGRFTVLGSGGDPRYAANPGLTPSFRRTLPETGCLSQGLPHGKRFTWPCPPKTVKPFYHRGVEGRL